MKWSGGEDNEGDEEKEAACLAGWRQKLKLISDGEARRGGAEGSVWVGEVFFWGVGFGWPL